MKTLKIRAHHGMCLRYFEGKGYDHGFTRHMQKVSECLKEDTRIQVVDQADVICQNCPNLTAGVCESREKVRNYDQGVLDACNLGAGAVLTWGGFSRLVEEKLLCAGKRSDICGDCQWNDVCEKKEKEKGWLK